jgi:hypothetical protein
MVKIINEQKSSNMFDSDVFWMKSSPTFETETREHATNCNIIERSIDFNLSGFDVNKETVKRDNLYEPDFKGLVDNNMNEFLNINSGCQLFEELNIHNLLDHFIPDKIFIE